MPGIEPGTFHMQSERSTAELQPHFNVLNDGITMTSIVGKYFLFSTNNIVPKSHKI